MICEKENVQCKRLKKIFGRNGTRNICKSLVRETAVIQVNDIALIGEEVRYCGRNDEGYYLLNQQTPMYNYIKIWTL